MRVKLITKEYVGIDNLEIYRERQRNRFKPLVRKFTNIELEYDLNKKVKMTSYNDEVKEGVDVKVFLTVNIMLIPFIILANITIIPLACLLFGGIVNFQDEMDGWFNEMKILFGIKKVK